jgi:Asp-tRNA(Asn)/Glu-tRNA(Gln) amidotransferase B subunit
MAERYERYQKANGLSADDADLLSADAGLAQLFEDSVKAGANAKATARWLLNDLLGLAKDRPVDSLPLKAPQLARFVGLVESGRITPSAGKVLLGKLVESGGDPEKLVDELKLAKVTDTGALAQAIGRVLEKNAAEVTRYRAGEKKLFGALMGAVMREVQGADAAAVRQALTEKLG